MNIQDSQTIYIHAFIFQKSNRQNFLMSSDIWNGIVSCKSIYLLVFFFRSLAWHNVLQVNLFCTLLKNIDYGN